MMQFYKNEYPLQYNRLVTLFTFSFTYNTREYSDE